MTPKQISVYDRALHSLIEQRFPLFSHTERGRVLINCIDLIMAIGLDKTIYLLEDTKGAVDE